MEVERASRSVRHLGSLLFEMEVLRSFLVLEPELKYFDKRVIPGKIRAYIAIRKLKGNYVFPMSIVNMLLPCSSWSLKFLHHQGTGSPQLGLVDILQQARQTFHGKKPLCNWIKLCALLTMQGESCEANIKDSVRTRR